MDQFGSREEAAVMKELQSIHYMNIYTPMYASILSYEERKEALASLLFITEKRYSDIKAQKCAVRNEQRQYEGYD